MKKIIFEEKYIECFLDDSIPVLAHKWISQPTSQEFQTALVKMSELFKKYKVEFPNLTWYGDTTNLGILKLDAQEWLKEKWSDIMIRAGIKYHALVVPNDVFVKFSMTKFQMDTKKKEKVVMNQFADIASANEWLQSCVSAR